MAQPIILYPTQTPPGPVGLLDAKKRPQSIIGQRGLTFSMWSIDPDRPRTDVYRDVAVTAFDEPTGKVNWPADWNTVIAALADAPGTYICVWNVLFATGSTPQPFPSPGFQRVVILPLQAG